MSNNLHTSLFDLTSIHQRYWKDFCDVCYSRFGFEQGEVRTYEQKYETFCRCKNYVTSEEGYEEQLLMTKEEDLKRLYDVLLMFNNLRDAIHMIPMLLSLDSMVKTTVESLNADKELIKRVSPRTLSIDYEHYCHLFKRKPEYREDIINDIQLKDFEDGWLKDILLRTDLPLYNSDEVSRSARRVARALVNQVIISINELVAILPEEGACPRGTELQAFIYRLFMSYETSLADIKEELEEYPAGLGIEHLKKECEELIKKFQQTHLGQHWCSCIEHKNGLQSIAKYFMHHRKHVSEEEERAFFYILDKICIISDILGGKADKYWLEVEYPDGWECQCVSKHEHTTEHQEPNPLVDAIREQTEAMKQTAEAMKELASLSVDKVNKDNQSASVTKQETIEDAEIIPNTTEEAIADAIRHVMEAKDDKGDYVFTQKNQWFAIYRILADMKIVQANGFLEFGRFIDGLNLTDIRVNLNARELSKNNKGTLSERFEKWNRSEAVSQIQFDKINRIAQLFKAKIEELIPE